MPRPGIRGPPGPRRAPQVDSWWRSEPGLHLLSTTTPQGPWCHYLQGPSGGSAHGGPAQQQGDRNREVKALVQGHTARKWQSRDLNRQGLDSRPSPHLGLLRFPKGSWAGQGVGETLVPTSQTKRTFWNFWKSEKKKKTHEISSVNMPHPSTCSETNSRKETETEAHTHLLRLQRKVRTRSESAHHFLEEAPLGGQYPASGPWRSVPWSFPWCPSSSLSEVLTPQPWAEASHRGERAFHTPSSVLPQGLCSQFSSAENGEARPDP